MTAETRADVYTRIAAEIVAINAGSGEWRMPSHHDGSSVVGDFWASVRSGV